MAVEVSALPWDGSLLNEPYNILKQVKNKYSYWYIHFPQLGETHWVCRRIITDLRPVIANEMKLFFNLPALMIHVIPFGARYSLLIKSSIDPERESEETLSSFFRRNLHTEDTITQAQLTFAFRLMMQMDQNNDSSVIVKTEGYRTMLYSFNDHFEPVKVGNKKIRNIKEPIPEVIYTRWFEPRRTTSSDAIQKLIGVKIPDPLNEEEMTAFSETLDRLGNQLEILIKKVDPDLIWYCSDVTNFLIARMSP